MIYFPQERLVGGAPGKPATTPMVAEKSRHAFQSSTVCARSGPTTDRQVGGNVEAAAGIIDVSQRDRYPLSAAASCIVDAKVV